MAEVAKDHSRDWQALGVSLLHRLVIDDLLGGKDLPKPNYVHLVEEVVEGLAHRRVPAGGRGHAGHGRPRPHDQHAAASGCRPRAPTSIRSCSADW